MKLQPTVQVKYSNFCGTLKIYVVNGIGPNLMDLNWLQHICLDWKSLGVAVVKNRTMRHYSNCFPRVHFKGHKCIVQFKFNMKSAGVCLFHTKDCLITFQCLCNTVTSIHPVSFLICAVTSINRFVITLWPAMAHFGQMTFLGTFPTNKISVLTITRAVILFTTSVARLFVFTHWLNLFHFP